MRCCRKRVSEVSHSFLISLLVLPCMPMVQWKDPRGGGVGKKTLGNKVSLGFLSLGTQLRMLSLVVPGLSKFILSS